MVFFFINAFSVNIAIRDITVHDYRRTRRNNLEPAGKGMPPAKKAPAIKGDAFPQ
jgi:hypothetical protein